MIKMHPKVVDITHQLNIVQRLLLLIPAAGISFLVANEVGPTLFEWLNGRYMVAGQHFLLSIMLFASLAIPIFQTNKDRTVTSLQKILLLLPTYGVLYIPSGLIVKVMRDFHIVDYRNDEDWWIAVTVMATASVAVFLFKKDNSQLELKETDSFSEMEQNNGSSSLAHDAQNKIAQEDLKQQAKVNHDKKVEFKQQLEALEKAYAVGILSKSEYDSKKSSINSSMKDI